MLAHEVVNRSSSCLESRPVWQPARDERALVSAGKRYLREQVVRFGVGGEHHAVVVEDVGDVSARLALDVEGVAAGEETSQVVGGGRVGPAPGEGEIGTGLWRSLEHVEG